MPKTVYGRIAVRLTAAGCLVIASQMVFAASAPRPAAGQKLSQQYCAECHVVAPNGKAGWTDAPAFEVIANKRGTTAQSLRNFIEQPHMHMVNTGRPASEASDIAAYILSFRKR